MIDIARQPLADLDLLIGDAFIIVIDALSENSELGSNTVSFQQWQRTGRGMTAEQVHDELPSSFPGKRSRAVASTKLLLS